MASAAAEETSRTVRPQLFPIQKDDSRDDLLTDFGKETLKDRYLLPGESFQDLFVRVASAYADDTAHAQRIYDYISRLWFMPATPVLSDRKSVVSGKSVSVRVDIGGRRINK